VNYYFLFFCDFGFQNEMQNFTTLIVNMVQKEKLFASQGGPIILSQVIGYLIKYLIINKLITFTYFMLSLCTNYILIDE
jgi:hypothetical protein